MPQRHRHASLVALLVLWSPFYAVIVGGLEVVLDETTFDYWIVARNSHSHENNRQVLFTGTPIAVWADQSYCSVADGTLQLHLKEDFAGTEIALGRYHGVALHWNCNHFPDALVTSFKQFQHAILFETTWPLGATYESAMPNADAALTQFPSLLPHTNFSTLSWQGSFMTAIHDTYSKGPQGGPTVFYDANDLETVVIGSWWGGNWKSFSAGIPQNGTWSPGTSGRITTLPHNYTQSILLYSSVQNNNSVGIVGGMYEWGQVLQRARHTSKLHDVTLSKIGYQTDNGAYYCFCKDENCSAKLLQTMEALYDVGIGYLSFQGAGASYGRGQAAPWCVSKWGVDGGLGRQFPMPLTEFHRALRNLPMQYYAPYFCPNSSYFDPITSDFDAVRSDPTLPHCDGFDFLNVHPSQSKAFYSDFFDRGIKAGMRSFESDFMNQNYNCVPEFISNTEMAQTWQTGMADAALERNLTIQWCYASPTDVMASLDFASVTNFRVSFDFCYGNSWRIGESSLLPWALGAHPSKDTLWTSVNDRTATPGCRWTPDHEQPAIELHSVLALLSTGPVGISDAFYQTNKTIVRAMVAANGDLLQPSRAIVVVDSTFVDPILKTSDSGFVYGTSGVGRFWIFVSFKLQQPYHVKRRDFWPRSKGSALISRHMWAGSKCMDRSCLSVSQTSHGIQNQSTDSVGIVLPASDFSNVTGGTDFAPSIVQVWEPCHSQWTLLGELDKYVPLSPQRFRHVTCLKEGVAAKVHLRFKERITIYAMSPESRVVHQTLHLARGGMINVTFGAAVTL